MILLDTNVVSELMRATPDPAVGDWLMRLGDTPLATTTVTISEIAFGLHRLPAGKRRDGLWTRFDSFTGAEGVLSVIGFDAAAAHEAGRFRALRESLGLSAQPSDMMIAGIAAAHGASLATRNEKDFSDLPLQVINPWTSWTTPGKPAA